MTTLDYQRRVLIVDDQTEIHETFARIFRSTPRESDDLDDFEARFLDGVGHRDQQRVEGVPQFALTHAYSGEEGVHHLEQATKNAEELFSVAFVDMRMPKGMDGLETIECLWRIDPSLQVVICTAHSDHTWGRDPEAFGTQRPVALAPVNLLKAMKLGNSLWRSVKSIG